MWIINSAATSSNWEKEISWYYICNCPGSSSRLSCGVSRLEVPNFAKSRFGSTPWNGLLLKLKSKHGLGDCPLLNRYRLFSHISFLKSAIDKLFLKRQVINFN
jgi:hypothetical protein